MINSSIQWIVFDYYGVIAVDATMEAARRLHDQHIDLAVRDVNKQKDLGKLPIDLYVQRLEKILGVTKQKAQWLENPADTYDPHLVAYIKQLKSDGHNIAIASNSYRPSILHAIAEAGLDSIVDQVVSSSEIGVVKPMQLFWQKLEEVLGAEPSSCIFIDDRQENCDAAKAYGFHAIRYGGLDNLEKRMTNLLRGQGYARAA